MSLPTVLATVGPRYIEIRSCADYPFSLLMLCGPSPNLTSLVCPLKYGYASPDILACFALQFFILPSTRCPETGLHLWACVATCRETIRLLADPLEERAMKIDELD